MGLKLSCEEPLSACKTLLFNYGSSKDILNGSTSKISVTGPHLRGTSPLTLQFVDLPMQIRGSRALRFYLEI